MTKKKMIAVVLIGVFVLYGCAIAANYTSALEVVCDKADDWWGHIAQSNLLSDFIDSGETDFSVLHRTLYYKSPKNVTFMDLPYSYMVVDRDKNVIIQSGSTVWARARTDEPDCYIPLEPYMTSEIKAEILEFKKSALNESINIDEIEIRQESGVCIPVSVTFEDLKGNVKKIKFNDGQADRILTEDNATFELDLYDLDEKAYDHKHYLEAQEAVRREVEEQIVKENEGGGGGYGFPAGGEFDYHSSFKGYLFVTSTRYSSFEKTVTSYHFKGLLSQTTVLFGIVGIIILVVAVKLFNKNQRLKENQRAFTSAVAHEMKTPLAVIQNQCECILDGIAPEKNEQYVRSVYEEAQKMNGMVQSFLTFNRLAGADSVEKQRLNLGELVIKEIGNYENFAAAKGRKIRTELPEDIFVNGNEELLSMAVGNYISNAIRHSAEASEIEIRLTSQGKNFSFEIFNKAEPIDVTKNVWSILSKGDSSRGGSDSSSGMGLPICKRIFELHGFEYGYKNEDGGVRFFFKGKVL